MILSKRAKRNLRYHSRPMGKLTERHISAVIELSSPVRTGRFIYHTTCNLEVVLDEDFVVDFRPADWRF